MDGYKTDWRTWVLLDNFTQGKRVLRRSKAMIVSYYANEHLIQLIRSGTLRAYPKLKGFLGVRLDKTS